MPKRERAPQIGAVALDEHKSRERQIKRLVQIRLGYGKSAFFDTHTHKPRYPWDVLGPAIIKARYQALKAGLKVIWSNEEQKFLDQHFKPRQEEL
jgi:hypothetical protein